MKKLILTGLLFIGLMGSSQAEIISTNLVTSSAGGDTFLLLAGRANVYSVEISSTYPALVKLYDQSTLAGPYFGTNYVTAAYTGRSSYATNIASSYVGMNGYTNWYTNSGIFTYSVTNAAATNVLATSAAFAVNGGTYVVYATDMLFNRGIVAHSSTNATIVVNYRNAQ